MKSKTWRLRGAAFVVAGLLAGCTTMVGAGPKRIPDDARTTCEDACTQVGMRLTNIVVMAANVGCVCGEPGDEVASSGAAGGAITVMLADQAEQQRRRDRRR